MFSKEDKCGYSRTGAIFLLLFCQFVGALMKIHNLIGGQGRLYSVELGLNETAVQ